MDQSQEISALRDRVEELEDVCSASTEVNKHLAQEVERLALENDSLKQHIQRLKKRLKKPPEISPEADSSLSGDNNNDDDDADAIYCTQDWARLQSLAKSRGWIVDPNQVEISSVIGEGSFGATYKSIYRGADCATKIVKIADGSAEAFSREFSALITIHHPNVLSVYGAVINPPDQCWLITEYLSGGTLAQWLHGSSGYRNSRRPHRSLIDRLRMALDIACGMEALEQHDPPIIHRDLKPSNILLTSDGRAKVSDFGLARVLTPSALVSLTPETGSYLYMAPEVIRHELYATQADVWSWACIVSELLTIAKPYSEKYLTPVQCALHVADGELRPTIPLEPSQCPPALVELLQAALHSDPIVRPSFALIASVMRTILQREEQRMKLEGNFSSGGGGVVSAWQRWRGTA